MDSGCLLCLILCGSLLCVALIFFIAEFNVYSSADPPAANSSGPRSVDSLKLVVVVSRHGNRGSYFTFKNDPYPFNNSVYWPYGQGELTTHGRLQMYMLGEKIRSLYNGFLDEEYFPANFSAQSTAVDRTLVSAGAFTAGLYPPKGFQLWNKNISWQPIPIYSNSPDRTMVIFFCPHFMQLRASGKAEFEAQYATDISTVLNYTNNHTGAGLVGALGLLSVWDTFISETTEGYVLPDWTGEVFPDPMTNLTGKLYIGYLLYSVEEIRLLIGEFFDEMIGAMKTKVSGKLVPDRQMYYYSGHDTSIVSLQAVLGIPKSSIIGNVKPGSALLFELHQNPNTTAFYVEVLYIDGSSPDLEPIYLDIPGCGQTCDFNQLLSITQQFTNVNYSQECQVV